jgi:hypothetical protein
MINRDKSIERKETSSHILLARDRFANFIVNLRRDTTNKLQELGIVFRTIKGTSWSINILKMEKGRHFISN